MAQLGTRIFHDTSNDNRVILADFAIQINSAVKSTIFPHSNAHEYTYTPHYHDRKRHSSIPETYHRTCPSYCPLRNCCKT